MKRIVSAVETSADIPFEIAPIKVPFRQRCQFHLQRNAQAHVPSKAMQPQVIQDIRDIFNASNGDMARMRLKYYVEQFAHTD
jgi:hypothetical protein